MKKTIFYALMITALCPFFSCKNTTSPSADSNSINIEISNGNKADLITEPQKWHITNKRICVLFGYDFNSDETVNELTALLQKNFGLDEDGGLIYPLVYPSSFKHGAKSYSNDFLQELQADDKDFCGVILLGAPDQTHKALAKNQDKWEQKIPYPVFALFPQDDVLGIEATCDIVLDKGQSAELAQTMEESAAQFIPEVPEILISSVNFILSLNGPLESDTSIQNYVSQIYKDQKIHHYSDPETGLQSINHFVLN